METSLPTVAVPSGDGPSAVVSIDSTCCVTGPLRTALARTAALHRAINLRSQTVSTPELSCYSRATERIEY